MKNIMVKLSRFSVKISRAFVEAVFQLLLLHFNAFLCEMFLEGGWVFALVLVCIFLLGRIS